MYNYPVCTPRKLFKRYGGIFLEMDVVLLENSGNIPNSTVLENYALKCFLAQ